MPKLNLYRNISITFVVFVAILLVAIFLFLSNKATVIVTPNPQKISLSFNLEVKENPTTDEIAEKDIIAGKLEVYTKTGTTTAEVLSTKSVSSDVVGQVELINKNNKDQSLVKTTQLQAANGVIVRTTESVIVPAGGSVKVSVIAKDPEDFKDIEPGNLVIIKLNPTLQDKIYAVAENALNSNPHDVKVLADSDIARAKDKLTEQLVKDFKQEYSLPENSDVMTSVKSVKTSSQLGAEVESFELVMELEIKSLKLTNEEQLAALIVKKVNNLNLSGLSVGQVNVDDIEFTIIEDDLNGSVLVKINYFIMASIDENNALLNRDNIVGKRISDVKDLLQSNEEVIADVEILASPYWTKSLPKQESKINIIIK